MARIKFDLSAAATGCDDGCDCEADAVGVKHDPRLRRWAWWLTALTIAWNSAEAVVAIVSGLLAGSIALVGFGLDSVVEVSSAFVIVWRLSRHGTDHAANERAEKRAVRLIAVSFVAIACYVTYDSAAKLLGIDDRFGSIEVGKAADLVLYDGDPFEHATHVTHTLIDGRLAWDRTEYLKIPFARRALPLIEGGGVGCCLGW